MCINNKLAKLRVSANKVVHVLFVCLPGGGSVHCEFKLQWLKGLHYQVESERVDVIYRP